MAAVTIAAPLLTIAGMRTDLLYERYFLVPSAFALLSFSFFVAAASRRSVWLGTTLIAAFLAPNLLHTTRLITLGRSNYLGALAYISDHAVQRPVTVGGDHDFRQGRLVEFYRPFVPVAADLEYHTPPEWADAGPEWMLEHSFDPHFQPAQTIVLTGGRRYQLSEVYPHAGLSGWHLAVYHNVLALGR
jgi:hypothetical protein